MRLNEVLSEVATLSVEGSLDRDVVGIALDSRSVLPGMMFVAMPGGRSDGHEHIRAAIDRGACAVICERNGFVSRRATRIKVADTRAALARAAATFYGRPSDRLRVIGVTGTNGKTVVSFLIRHFLESAGCRTGLIGSVRYEVGDRSIPAQRTTPEAVDVQNLMAQMERKGCGACVLEVSSHALKQRRVEAVEFNVGVFTNLSGEHLDYHGSLESYYGAKRRLFELVEAGGKRGAMVVNTDDAAGRRLMGDLGPGIRWTYGLGAGTDVLAREPRYGASGTRVRIETPRGAWEARSPLLGRFNVYNLLAAVGAAMALEVPVSVLRDAIPGLPQVPGRLERVDWGQPFNVLVDYAHTEAALRQVLLTVREVTAGRVRLVFGCGGMRDPAKRRPMGRAAGELADDVVVTSDNPRDESPHDIAMAIGSGLADAGRETWRVELDRGRAIEEAIREAQPGDSVVVAGKGHEGYQEFEDTVVPFDDRMHASQALEILGWRGSTGGGVVGSN